MKVPFKIVALVGLFGGLHFLFSRYRDSLAAYSERKRPTTPNRAALQPKSQEEEEAKNAEQHNR